MQLHKLDASPPELEKRRIRARQICHKATLSLHEKVEILSKLFFFTGENLTIWGTFFCEFGDNISLGDDVFLNTNCVILDSFPVKIGNRTAVGPNVGIYTTNHSLNAAERSQQIEYGGPIQIGEDVWIGGNVCILPGVTIGDACVIGAGSIVTRNLPANTILRGPAQRSASSLDKG